MNSLQLAVKQANHAAHTPDYKLLVEARAHKIQAFMDKANAKTISMLAHDAVGRNDTITLDALLSMGLIAAEPSDSSTDH